MMRSIKKMHFIKGLFRENYVYNVFVFCQNSDSCEILIHVDTSIEAFKNKIESEVDISFEDYDLTFNGVLLEDEKKTLRDYDIERYSKVYCILKFHQPIVEEVELKDSNYIVEITKDRDTKIVKKISMKNPETGSYIVHWFPKSEE